MHEHDQEIIMALAEGTLDDANAAVAEARLADCAECVRDLELQRIALGALGEAPPVYMSATESARLHKALKGDLSMAVSSPAQTQPRPAWGRWAGLAFGFAAMFLGAVLVVPALFGGSDDSDTAAIQEIAGDGLDDESRGAIESVTTAAASATTSAALAAPSAAAGEVGEEGVAADTGGVNDMALTTTTPDSGSRYFTTFTGDATVELRERVLLFIEEGTDDFRLADEAAKQLSPDIIACAATAQEEVLPSAMDSFVVGTIVGNDGVERYLVAYVPADTEATVIAAITLPTCEVFQTVP